MSRHEKVRPHPDVVDTAVGDDEVALLHLNNKNYFSLNVTGARVWELLKEDLSLDQVCQRLQDEFSVDAQQAQRSVHDLVEELIQHDLVEIDR